MVSFFWRIEMSVKFINFQDEVASALEKAEGMVELELKALQAVLEGDCETIENLIQKVVSPSAKPLHGIPLLHIATTNRDIEVMQLLMEKGAKVNAVDERGQTALHLAAQNKEGEYLISCLYEYGALCDIKDEGGVYRKGLR